MLLGISTSVYYSRVLQKNCLTKNRVYSPVKVLVKGIYQDAFDNGWHFRTLNLYKYRILPHFDRHKRLFVYLMRNQVINFPPIFAKFSSSKRSALLGSPCHSYDGKQFQSSFSIAVSYFFAPPTQPQEPMRRTFLLLKCFRPKRSMICAIGGNILYS